jgi:hypothetical protein
LSESGLGPDAIPYPDRPIGPVAEQLLHHPAGRLAADLPPVDDPYVAEEALHLEGAAALLRARGRDVPDGRKRQQRRDQGQQDGSDAGGTRAA